ncbi:hypothetical protein CGCSCA4_v008058 [Colletotrichum siamense]|uniref:Heterokaryon incompatibility domain-containing protein n=1 Tax=Colletotrichum siamense TaxID=690259 RepID=A0A9P5ETI6_COLSI|nr:hypothetical protein CGCSCA4_v008058 [Colletotrichum siamense]KAF4859164.1 hypothetical protein CGCSCA2_v006562 [Colletotrichum siamense]
MSTLCKKCQVVQFNDADLNGTVETLPSGQSYFAPHLEGEEHHHCVYLDYDLKDVLPDLPVLPQSAENGCSLCFLIKTEIARFLTSFVESERKYSDFFIHKLCYVMGPHTLGEPPFRTHLQALCIYFRLLNEASGEEDLSWQLQLAVQADPHDPCAQWLSIPRQPVQEDILSEAGMRRLNELMEMALQIPLATVTKDRRLPTRLIDVGFRGLGKENDEPRLVITADYPPLQNPDEDQRYVALSYCWGPSEKAARQLMTKTSTLKDRLSQIPFSTLPKTHQDALQICTLLGVRYIWIDSLCIVQDDKSDWEREADQMGVVYARAYLTICAGQGNSCLDGFLTRAYPSNSAEIHFTSSLKPAVSGRFSLFAPSRECPKVLPLVLGEEFDSFFLGLTLYDPYRDDQDCSWNGRV